MPYDYCCFHLKRGQVRQASLALITINPERSNPFRAYQHQWFINAIATKRLQSASAQKDKCGIPKNAHRSIERIVHSYSRTPAKAGINKSFGGSSSSEVHQYSCPNERVGPCSAARLHFECADTSCFYIEFFAELINSLFIFR